MGGGVTVVEKGRSEEVGQSAVVCGSVHSGVESSGSGRWSTADQRRGSSRGRTQEPAAITTVFCAAARRWETLFP